MRAAPAPGVGEVDSGTGPKDAFDGSTHVRSPCEDLLAQVVISSGMLRIRLGRSKKPTCPIGRVPATIRSLGPETFIHANTQTREPSSVEKG